MSGKQDQTDSGDDKEVATLAGGCFWCLEAIFDELKGVEQVVSGYSGGTVVNPSYHAVCTGTTGHAEVVQVTFVHIVQLALVFPKRQIRSYKFPFLTL